MEDINGVTVYRFPVDVPRDMAAFSRLSDRVFHQPHSYLDELEWMRQQGPCSSRLLEFIGGSRAGFDLFIFVTYLYFTTYFGLQLVPEKSLLVPTAHDEPPIYLDLFRPLFHLPRAIVYNTDTERDFVVNRFQNGHVLSQVIGTGVILPEPATPSVDWRRSAVGGRRSSVDFRARHGLSDPFLLYAGRIDEAKNCRELFEYFLRYKAETHSPVKLALMGKATMPIPQHPDIVPLGFVSEEEKFAGFQAAALLLVPSRYESLSIASLEAWLMGTPVLVNGHCQVLKENCLRSNGGLYYTSYDEFAMCLETLLGNEALRRRLGQQGKRYAEENYGWAVIEGKYLDLFRQVTLQK
jgi:glycosyltransferase involved in cell wall biosynthesis